LSLDRLTESDAAHTPADPSSRLDAQRKVRLLAASLAPAEMEVLVLHLVHGFTVREIAGLTGRSWRAIDALLFRARGKARERLAHDEQ
jgi:DNA-directed RNA polymerase specialized sigma24 family protein